MRGFLRTAGVIVVLFLSVGVVAANDYFPQSVASGDPTPSSVVLWTRAIADDGEPPATVDLTVATDAGLTSVVVTRSIEVDPQYDGVVKLRVEELHLSGGVDDRCAPGDLHLFSHRLDLAVADYNRSLFDFLAGNGDDSTGLDSHIPVPLLLPRPSRGGQKNQREE